MQRKTWYSILGVDAKPLSFKLVTYVKWGNLAYVKAVRLLRVALAPLLCCFKTYLPICSLTLSSIPTSNYSPKLAPCIQSHYREVTRWKIFMEQKLRFWLSLGSTENTCILLPNKSILCIDS